MCWTRVAQRWLWQSNIFPILVAMAIHLWSSNKEICFVIFSEFIQPISIKCYFCLSLKHKLQQCAIVYRSFECNYAINHPPHSYLHAQALKHTNIDSFLRLPNDLAAGFWAFKHLRLDWYFRRLLGLSFSSCFGLTFFQSHKRNPHRKFRFGMIWNGFSMDFNWISKSLKIKKWTVELTVRE